METTDELIKMIKSAYPKRMSKDQFYKVAHISKATALYLLKSGLVPCKDSGKKTRRYSIKTDDVIRYLHEREADPRKFLPPDCWYSTKAGSEPSKDPIRSIMLCLNDEQRNLLAAFFYSRLASYGDLLSTAQVCEFLGYSSSTPVNWCVKGKIDGFLISGRYLIPKASLIEFLISNEAFCIVGKSEAHKLLLTDFIRLNNIGQS